MAWVSEVPIAHRGLHDRDCGRPENTLAAFEAAAAAGVPVELDVHLSRDGVAVVVHDEDVGRLTGRPARVGALTAAELGRLAVQRSDQTIPSLGDVLDLLAGRVPAMVEVKNRTGRVGPLEAAVLRAVEGREDDASVASFNPRTVAWFAEHASHILRGQTAATFRGVAVPPWLKPLLRKLAFNVRTRPHYVSYELGGLPSRPVGYWRARGLPVVAWTVRSLDDLQHARAHADNFMFEELAVDVVGAPSVPAPPAPPGAP